MVGGQRRMAGLMWYFGGIIVMFGLTHGELVGSLWGLGGETVGGRVQVSRQSGAS